MRQRRLTRIQGRTPCNQAPPRSRSVGANSEKVSGAMWRLAGTTRRSLCILARVQRRELRDRRQWSPQVVWPHRLGAADDNPGQCAAVLGVPAEKARLAFGGDNI